MCTSRRRSSSPAALLWWPLVVALAACGDDGQGGSSDASPTDADVGSVCSAAAQALADEFYVTPQACAAVVRLDYQTRAILGHQVFCADYASVLEMDARAVAQSDTGYGQNGTGLHPANPEDLFVFYESPGDFGGVAAVSAYHGESVFGGSIVWDGTGDITYPSAWRPAAELAENCTPTGDLGVTHGYDLAQGGPLDQAQVDQVADVIERTALPRAMWAGGYVFNTVVLLYPRTVGVFDPAAAEWVAIVSGGWLE